MKIPREVEKIIETLEAGGFEAYAVGGCVRDTLLGGEPEDGDITTSARPEQGKRLVRRTIDTGIQHGTVTVLENHRGFEVTTYRIDGEYEDGRHPKNVEFTASLTEDLKRRDFTINAMAYDPAEGLIDPFGGREDLLVRRVVRAVGEPARRFEEDGLRILRLYRFGAREELALDPATARAALQERARLGCVSAERIWQELAKLLAARRPGRWMPFAVLELLLPGLDGAQYPGSIRAVDALPPDPLARLAALLAPAGPEKAARALEKLRCSRAEAAEVLALVKESGLALTGEAPRLQARRLLARLDPGTVRRLLALRQAQTGEKGFAALASAAAALEQEQACCRVAQLAVNGRDLLALGVRPGPAVGRLLSAALEQVVEEKLPNDRAALLGWLRTQQIP